MHPLKQLSLFFLSFAAATSAAIIAERGLPDGIYQVVRQQNHAESPSSISSRRPSLRRRDNDLFEKSKAIMWEDYSVPIPVSRVRCYKSHGQLNNTDYRRAVDNLWSYCLLFNIAPHGAYFSVVGEAVAFVCSYGGLSRCHRHEWNEAEEKMDKKCGEGRDSHVEMNKWLKEYGRSHTGEQICNSYNMGVDITWKEEMLPVWVNEQMYHHWKAGVHKDNKVGGSKNVKTG
ncbi:hypothetical protein TARUN_628 [Trichoderma arundinaceum]|uniref:Uncharacterized protein n=1 Tax=Trichoderma arundinaceum TaxID=490622 RepID=A0A395NZR1_TRIAR|nr:hypothetical protein TARUN_628 [Trichoderma arundinaceum]